MNSLPRVSVLMAAHNEESSVQRAVMSILGQSMQDFEMVIIDDGSSDGTHDILLRLAAIDDRIRIFRNSTNIGLAASLNRGLREVRAPWVARMDADDVALEQRLRAQLEHVVRHPDLDILGTWMLVDTGDGDPWLRKAPVRHEEIVRLMWSCPVFHPTVMYRRSAIIAVGGYDESLRRRQDFDMWFRCVEAGFRFGNLAEPHVLYRDHGDFFEKNGIRVALSYAQIGMRGCRRIGASPIAYVGVLGPLARFLAPPPLRHLAYSLSRSVDPRQRFITCGPPDRHDTEAT
jgi:glycosyltransferase involved in cell wall biosynthesis